ncbi:MAG: LysE family translocator [Granulosicoccaceae bacterium]
MAIELWLAFVLASCVLLIIPGPTILTVISYSIAHGKRANVPLVAAVALGDSTALLLSLAGLGAVLATSAWMFTAVKVVGGLYLIYLGVKLLLAKTSPIQSTEAQADEATPMKSRWKLFANTWLVTALNPKGIIFFVAFLPQFIDKMSAVVTQLWVLSVTFVALASLNACLYAVFASGARKLLSSPAAQRRFNIGGGTLLTIAGGWALTAQRSA